MLLNEQRAKNFLERYNLDAIVSSSRENTTYLTDFLAVSYIHDKMASGPSTSPGWPRETTLSRAPAAALLPLTVLIYPLTKGGVRPACALP